MKPGSRTQVILQPGQDFQRFDGNEEIDVFYEKGQRKIIMPKRVFLLQAEQVGEANGSDSKGRKVSGVG